MSQKLRFYIFGPGPIKFGLKTSYFELKSQNFFSIYASKYIPEEKFWENFKHENNTNLKFF